MISVFTQLVRDKVVWIGSLGSTVSTTFAVAERLSWAPKDLQGWLAAMLTTVTILYILAKTYFLVRTRKIAAGE